MSLLDSHRFGPPPWSPSDLPDLEAWYTAASLSLGDASAIPSWADLSGNSRDLAQGTANQRPSERHNVINGRTVARFDGVNDNIKSAAFTIAQPFTVYLLAKMTTAPASGVNAIFDGDTANSSSVQAHLASTRWRYAAGGTAVQAALYDTSWHTFVAIFDGASSVLYVDGGTGTTGNPGANSLTAVTLGAAGNAGSNFNGDIAECIVVSHVSDLAEINLAGEYLADSAAIAWTTAV